MEKDKIMKLLYFLTAVSFLLAVLLMSSWIKIISMADAYNEGYNNCVSNCNSKLLEISERCGGVNRYSGIYNVTPIKEDTEVDIQVVG